MKWLSVLVVGLASLLGGVAHADVYITTGIGISTSTVSTYHSIEADYSTSYYYDVQVDAYIWRDSSVVQSGYDVDASYAERLLSTSTQLNRNYQAQSNYWVSAVYYYTIGSTIYYYDELGYELITPGGYGGDGTISDPGTPNTSTDQDYYIGSAYISDNTYPPSISGINVSGTPSPGGSGYVEVYGTNLAKWAGSTTSSISGSGVSTDITYATYADPDQVNLSYSIAPGAATGNRNLTITTPFGTSNAATFTIQP